MTRDINSEYFEWLCSLVRDSKPIKHRSYRKLMVYLYHTEFEYILPMDRNRCDDGISLRYRFGYEQGFDDTIIASCMDTPCSVLEMMVALALRCEEHIMQIPENGLMSGRWFWRMISNLGLEEMYDAQYDEDMVNCIIYRFLNRGYGPDGEGSLVYIPNSQYDLSTMEIWYQMMRYLIEYRRNELE